MALPSTTQSWMNSTNILNFGHDIAAAAERDISCYLPLHIAILQGLECFFENDPNTALALTDYFGNTALHAVAVLGNIIEAKLVVEKNPDLPNSWNNDGSLPLHLAAMDGQRKMTLFLLSVTRDDEESKPYESEAGATLMRFAINVGFYDLALDLLGRNPKLAWKDFSPLEVMAQEHSACPSGTCFKIWKCFIYTC